MRKIVVEKSKKKAVGQQRIELCERKGRGHPDFICDSVCEAGSLDSFLILSLLTNRYLNAEKLLFLYD